MTKCVYKFVVLFAAVVAWGLCESTEVRAAEVNLTSGSVVVNCPLGVSPNSYTGSIDLTGPDFNLHFFYDGGGGPCSPAPVQRGLSGGPAYDLSFYLVTFQGVTTMFTRGSLVFDETSISGTVEGQNINFQPLFTVNFTGAGVGSFSPSRSTFEVGAVPEPATLALLSVGVAAFGAARRYKNRRTLKSQTES